MMPVALLVPPTVVPSKDGNVFRRLDLHPCNRSVTEAQAWRRRHAWRHERHAQRFRDGRYPRQLGVPFPKMGLANADEGCPDARQRQFLRRCRRDSFEGMRRREHWHWPCSRTDNLNQGSCLVIQTSRPRGVSRWPRFRELDRVFWRWTSIADVDGGHFS